jgi:TRAP-type C4-dicarboxylate transport system substrate-binding protein
LVIGFWTGKLPLSTSLSSTIDLDLGNKLDMRGIASINIKLVEEFPEFMGEYKKLGVTPLLWVPTVPYGIISKEPIRRVEDLKGKKVRTFGKYLPQLFSAVGAVPMAVSFGEVYTSLQTGVIDAAVTDPPAMFTAGRFHEVAKYVTLTGPKWGAACSLAPVVYIINNKSFAKLSATDQNTIRKISMEMTMNGADLMTKTGAKAVSDLEKEGATIIRLPESEVKKWAAKCPDWYEKAAEALEEKGLPGKEVMARYQELARDYISGKWKGVQ